ncbi:MAG: hypothetical protein LBH47_02700 [Christensenellaceae bacterium]|jgi:oligoribonuclease NrnB/cAMP/cGMP phosphodiesterase (DHH superfamily)|nr:hypothetical protein [Christensenellaceae bacterium]
MIKDYLKELDREFSALLTEKTEAAGVVNATKETGDDISDKFSAIVKKATLTSMERYLNGFNAEIALADLLNVILGEEAKQGNDNFFSVLNEQRDIALDEALEEFDFYNNNPYKGKAKKTLTKLFKKSKK